MGHGGARTKAAAPLDPNKPLGLHSLRAPRRALRTKDYALAPVAASLKPASWMRAAGAGAGGGAGRPLAQGQGVAPDPSSRLLGLEAGARSRRTGKDEERERPTAFYHGTSIEAAFAIQKEGFRVDKSGSNAGQLLGHGVYMSGDLAKALSYANKHPNGGIVFELHVDLGNCKTCTREDLDGKGAWQQEGFDSAWAREGLTPNKSEENCVKDPRRVKLVRAMAGKTPMLRAMGMSIGEDGQLAMIGDLADGTSDGGAGGGGGGAGGGQKRKRGDVNLAYSPCAPMMCQDCEDTLEGTHFCEDCSLVLCGECTKNHRRSKRSKHHTLQTVTEFNERVHALSRQPATASHEQLACTQKETDDFLRQIEDVQHPLALPDIISGMRMHKAHSVQRKVSLALWGYTCNFDDRKAFVKEGGIEAVADVMMGNKTCEEIQFWGCRALMQLAGDNDEYAKIVATDKSVGAILEAFKEHSMHVNIPVLALTTLALIAKNHDRGMTIVEQGGIGAIVQVINTCMERQITQQHEIQVWGLRALGNLADQNTENAKRVVLAQGMQTVEKIISSTFEKQQIYDGMPIGKSPSVRHVFKSSSISDLRVLAAACRVVSFLAAFKTAEKSLSPSDEESARSCFKKISKAMKQLKQKSPKIGFVCEIQVWGFRALLSLVDNEVVIRKKLLLGCIVKIVRAVTNHIHTHLIQECLELLEDLVARNPDVRLTVLKMIIDPTLADTQTLEPLWFEKCLDGKVQMAWEKFARTLALPEFFLLQQAAATQQGPEDVAVQEEKATPSSSSGGSDYKHATAAGPKGAWRTVPGDDHTKKLFDHLMVRAFFREEKGGGSHSKETKETGVGSYPRSSGKLYKVLCFIIERTDDRWFKEKFREQFLLLEEVPGKGFKDVLQRLNAFRPVMGPMMADHAMEELFRLLLAAANGNSELLDVYTDERTAVRQTLVGDVIAHHPGDTTPTLSTPIVPSYYKVLLACCQHRASFIEYLLEDSDGDNDCKGGTKEGQKEGGKKGEKGGAEKPISQPAAGHTGLSDSNSPCMEAAGGDQGDTEMADDQQKAIGKEDQSDGGGGAGTPGRLTFEEKRKLSLDIGKLSHDKLGKVIEIIKKREKVADGEEIVINLDSLGESTLHELEKYAAECLNPTKPVNLLSVFFCLCFS